MPGEERDACNGEGENVPVAGTETRRQAHAREDAHVVAQGLVSTAKQIALYTRVRDAPSFQMERTSIPSWVAGACLPSLIFGASQLQSDF